MMMTTTICSSPFTPKKRQEQGRKKETGRMGEKERKKERAREKKATQQSERDEEVANGQKYTSVVRVIEGERDKKRGGRGQRV